MLADLQNSLSGDVMMGLAQAAGAVVLCLAVVALCRWFAVQVEREAAISIGRGLVQMVFVGVVLALLLHGSLLIGVLILLLMTIAAAATASRRLKGIGSPLLLSFWAIFAGSGVVIAAMLATKALKPDIVMLVPVGSMIIANAMNACAQAAERFRADVTAHVGQVEAGLALGAEPAATVAPYVQSAVYASLSAAPRYAKVAWARVDTRRDGRHGGVGREPRLCWYLSIHHRRHDPRRLRHHRAARDSTHASTCLLSGGAIDPPSRGAIANRFGKSLDVRKTQKRAISAVFLRNA
jgi:ABC-type iron transport system FetAB permease component